MYSSIILGEFIALSCQKLVENGLKLWKKLEVFKKTVSCIDLATVKSSGFK